MKLKTMPALTLLIGAGLASSLGLMIAESRAATSLVIRPSSQVSTSASPTEPMATATSLPSAATIISPSSTPKASSSPTQYTVVVKPRDVVASPTDTTTTDTPTAPPTLMVTQPSPAAPTTAYVQPSQPPQDGVTPWPTDTGSPSAQ